MSRRMREMREADESIGGELKTKKLDDPIAQDVDAGAASAQPIGPHCPARNNMSRPPATNSVSVRSAHCKPLLTQRS